MRIANELAGRKDLFDQLVQTSNMAGLDDPIRRFMGEHQAQLMKAFNGNEDAAYAFSALYVSQGMGGYLGNQSETRKELVNAIGDQFAAAASFGWALDINKPFDEGTVRKAGGLAEDPMVRQEKLYGEFAKREKAFESAMAAAPQYDPVAIMNAFATASQQMDLASVTGGQWNAMFSTVRENLDATGAKLLADSSSVDRFRSDGWWGYGQEITGLSDPETADRAALGMLYNKDNVPGNVEQSVANRLERYSDADARDMSGPVPKYMALAQLRDGAEQNGDHASAEAFQREMTAMEGTFAGLAGQSGERIQAVAAGSTTSRGFEDRLNFAAAEFDYGSMKAEVEANTEARVFDNGKEALWNPIEPPAPSAGMKGARPEIAAMIGETIDRYAADPRIAAAGLSPDEFGRVFTALVAQESGFNPGAVSPKGAIGLTQLMPATAQMMNVVDPFLPENNLDGGARYFLDQLGRFGSVDLALAAYNAGPGAVEKYDGVPPYRETQNYVQTIRSNSGV